MLCKGFCVLEGTRLVNIPLSLSCIFLKRPFKSMVSELSKGTSKLSTNTARFVVVIICDSHIKS